MKHLFVWIRRADARVNLAGELATTDPTAGGRFESEFEYSREWADVPHGFALDPVSLPLDTRGRRFRAEQLHPPLSVFEDALPDDWGRRLLTTALRLEGRKPTLPEMLLHIRGAGTGALMFTETPLAPRALASVQSKSLPALLSAAAKFEAGTLPPNDEFRKLLEGSSRAGGARPKALVHDAAGEWLAKFPSRARDASHDVVGLEAACLALAARTGLQVPEWRLQAVGRRRVLLVKRFDVTEQAGRVHMISMRTLCKERPGVFATGYTELADVLHKHSASPAADVASLFRHMTFNAAVGNVDDHLKNFWMLATPAGYRLAPAFDLVPDIDGRGEHTLSFQYGLACPKKAELVAVGRAWGVAKAMDIIDQVTKGVGTFAAAAGKLKVGGGKNLDKVRADIRRRRSLLS